MGEDTDYDEDDDSEPRSEDQEIGLVFDYYSKAGVAAIRLSSKLKTGDRIKILGHTTNFEQTVDSMQMKNKNVEEADAGDDIGIKVDDRVRKHDKIYLV